MQPDRAERLRWLLCSGQRSAQCSLPLYPYTQILPPSLSISTHTRYRPPSLSRHTQQLRWLLFSGQRRHCDLRRSLGVGQLARYPCNGIVDCFGNCSQKRRTRSTVTSTIRSAAHLAGCARCGAGAGCSVIKYQSVGQSLQSLQLRWLFCSNEGWKLTVGGWVRTC